MTGAAYLTQIVGNRLAKRALVLLAVDPGLGGVLLVGSRGTGKSHLARASARLWPPLVRAAGCPLNLPPGDHGSCPVCGHGCRAPQEIPAPFVTLPLNATEDRVLGGVHLEGALRTGRGRFEPGVLGRANGGVLFVDDLNLLPPEILGPVLEAHERGRAVVAREGLDLEHPARFAVVATADLDAAPLSPHVLDRFGLSAVLEPLGPGQRRRLLRREARRGGRHGPAARQLARAVAAARARLASVAVPDRILRLAVERAAGAGAAGHRAEIFLVRAARALAAWQGAAEVAPGHLDAVAPLVLAHRAAAGEHAPPEPEVPEPQEHPDAAPDTEPEAPEETGDRADAGGEAPPDGTPDPDPGGQGGGREEVFRPSEPFRVRRLHLRRDRWARTGQGRRTPTRTASRSGRYVGVRLSDAPPDVAVDATLRAAAPWQRARGRAPGGPVDVRPEDVRHKRRERRMGHLVVLCVDASGSMGAHSRMEAAKAAALSLLHDCYQRRDRVALVGFRRDRAEVLLPPCTSPELAARRLRDLPTGGRTPLAAGLVRCHEVVREASLRWPRIRPLVVLISDGRANVGLGTGPLLEELDACARALGKLPGLDALVVDTEARSNLLRTGLTERIARHLGAPVLPVEELRADELFGWVRRALDDR